MEIEKSYTRRKGGLKMNQARVIEYEEMLRSAMLSNNVELLEELLSDELIFVNHFGQWLSKEQDINAHRSKVLI